MDPCFFELSTELAFVLNVQAGTSGTMQGKWGWIGRVFQPKLAFAGHDVCYGEVACLCVEEGCFDKYGACRIGKIVSATLLFFPAKSFASRVKVNSAVYGRLAFALSEN